MSDRRLKILSRNDYEQICDKYPEKIKERISKAQGFTDTKRNIAFIKNRKKTSDLLPVVMHEVLELLATVSPHDEDGIRCKGGSSQPSVQTIQPSPIQTQQFEQFQQPYQEEQLAQFQNIFAPSSAQLGALLQQNLASPLTSTLTLPELNAPTPFTIPTGEWESVWQQAREKALKEYEPIERRQSQRFASTGALESSGQVGKWAGELELSKAKTIEDIAINQAIQEWQEQEQANLLNWQTGVNTNQLNWQNQVNQAMANWQQGITGQQLPIENMLRYLGYQPQFNIPMPVPQNVVVPGQSPSGILPAAIGGAATLGSSYMIASAI